MKKIDLSNPTDKQLKTGYLNYNTSRLVQILQNFSRALKALTLVSCWCYQMVETPCKKSLTSKKLSWLRTN